MAFTAAQDRREYDSNNWYEIFDNPISRVGVYQYSEGSIVKGGDRNKMVGVYRPAEELGSPECVESFRLMPWTDDHPSDLLGDASQGFVAADEKGVKGVIGEQTYFKDGTLYGNLKVFSEALARKIAGGKKQLSCGYHCNFIAEDGVFEGAPYQYTQRNMRGNHVASVREGRMGAGVRVLDSAEKFTFALDFKETGMRGRNTQMDATEIASLVRKELAAAGHSSAGFDAAEVTESARKLVARHEQMHERLSNVVGLVADCHEMTLAQLAAYGLEKMGLKIPDGGDEAIVTALEYTLLVRSNRLMGGGGVMDKREPSFVDRWLAGKTATGGSAGMDTAQPSFVARWLAGDA